MSGNFPTQIIGIDFATGIGDRPRGLGTAIRMIAMELFHTSPPAEQNADSERNDLLSDLRDILLEEGLSGDMSLEGMLDRVERGR